MKLLRRVIAMREITYETVVTSDNQYMGTLLQRGKQQNFTAMSTHMFACTK
jgi:hypothetical protein